MGRGSGGRRPGLCTRGRGGVGTVRTSEPNRSSEAALPKKAVGAPTEPSGQGCPRRHRAESALDAAVLVPSPGAGPGSISTHGQMDCVKSSVEEQRAVRL